MTDGRLDRAASPDHRAQAAHDTASQNRGLNLSPVDGDALVPVVDDGDLCLNVAQDPRLFQGIS